MSSHAEVTVAAMGSLQRWADGEVWRIKGWPGSGRSSRRDPGTGDIQIAVKEERNQMKIVAGEGGARKGCTEGLFEVRYVTACI